MHRLTGLSRPTITKGVHELTAARHLQAGQRVRRPGVGHKPLEWRQAGLDAALARLLEQSTAGDPMNHLRWPHKSTVALADELEHQGYAVSDDTVRRRLWAMGYTLQANAKALEGRSPPERDAQFRYINRQVQAFLDRGEPVLSIDTKKKERMGSSRTPVKPGVHVGRSAR
jgi:Rhodopirellula transposase DDE domain